MTNPTPQPTATDAEVTPSADLLTAAPLAESLKDILSTIAEPYFLLKCACGWVGSSKNCSDNSGDDCLCPNCFKENYKDISIAERIQQALADAATIADQSAAIWQVMACVRTYVAVTEWQPKASPSELQFYLNKIISSYNALLPSVHDLVWRGGR